MSKESKIIIETLNFIIFLKFYESLDMLCSFTDSREVKI